jgi:hypothetical protein
MTNQETNMVANLLRRVDALESLIREVLADEPKSECAENGQYCPFCYNQFGFRNDGKLMPGVYGVVHSTDCWIERAKRLLAE